MIAAIVNAITVIAGGMLGVALRNRLKESLQKALITGMALCTFVIGISSALKSEDTLCVIVCIAIGTLLGEISHIERGIDKTAEAIKNRLNGNLTTGGSFTQGLVGAAVLFCVGSMAIVGSLEAGINHNYSIIFAKSVIDFVSSMAMGAAMGIGVAFSSIFVLVYQGLLTLLAGTVGTYLSTAVVNEMSAAGGVILIGLALNLLELPKERIRVANMIPAIFLPILYVPLSNLISKL